MKARMLRWVPFLEGILSRVILFGGFLFAIRLLLAPLQPFYPEWDKMVRQVLEQTSLQMLAGGVVTELIFAVFGLLLLSLAIFVFFLLKDGMICFENNWGYLGGGSKGFAIAPSGAIGMLLLAELVLLGYLATSVTAKETPAKEPVGANAKSLTIIIQGTAEGSK